MNLELSEEQQLLRDTFAQLFAAESSPERVRAAEPLGFDPALWKVLAETGAPGIRVPEEHGGSGAGLLEAVLLAEQVGRHVASGPILETVVAAALLARCNPPLARDVLRRALDGTAALGFAPRSAASAGPQLVPGGAVADAVVGLDGDVLVLLTRGSAAAASPANLAASPIARWNLSAAPPGGERLVLA